MCICARACIQEIRTPHKTLLFPLRPTAANKVGAPGAVIAKPQINEQENKLTHHRTRPAASRAKIQRSPEDRRTHHAERREQRQIDTGVMYRHRVCASACVHVRRGVYTRPSTRYKWLTCATVLYRSPVSHPSPWETFAPSE